MDRIVKEIESQISIDYAVMNSIGVSNGIAGLSLFYYYFSQKFKENKYKDRISFFLELAIDKIDDQYKGNTFLLDILEIARLLTFYNNKGILTKDDIQFYFDHFDPLIREILYETLEKKDINSINGAISFANYFLNNKNISFYEEEIDSIISTIEDCSIVIHSNERFLYANIERDGERLIELSMANGLAEIINFLLDVYKNGIQEKRVKTLIEEFLKFLMKHQSTNQNHMFPFDAERKQDSFSNNLAYGDLGIGYVISKAGRINTDYLHVGSEIIGNASKFRDPKNLYVKDASLLYGSEGIVSFYTLMGNYLKLDFSKTISYWRGKTYDFKTENKNKWAGFDSYYNKSDANTQLSLSLGIAGIGVSLLNEELNLNSEYLSFLNYNL